MTPLFAYLLKVIVCSGILYGYYLLALRNKVFHSWNRFYLMASIVVAMLLPLMEPYIIAPASSESKVITALQVVAGADEYVTEIQQSSSISWDTGMMINAAYILIGCIVMCWLFFGLTRIYKMVRKYPKQQMQDVLFMNTREQGTPFSYFRYLFWNEDIDPRSVNGQKILEHELVHIREKHSYDKLFVHLVLTIYWANPFFWLIRKELAMVHEFIADQKTVTDTESFAQLILSATFPQHNSLLTNAYFQSSIKRRIAMITKNKNPKYQYISRILLIPVLFVLIFTFAVKANSIMNNPSVDLDKKVTVVIDAGHGGVDKGAINGEVYEKDLNFALAKRIKELNTNSKIEIVLSRDGDNTLPVTERTVIAEKANADLFISLHTAASPNKDKQGFEAYIAKNNSIFEKESNHVASLLLNNLSNVYITEKSIKKREQTIYVLDKNNRPSVLLENGFISNEKDIQFLSQSTNQDKIAKAILTSIEQYFSKAVDIRETAVDSLPAGKKIKSVTVTYSDGTKKTMTESEYQKQLPKKGVQSDTIYLKGKHLLIKSDEKFGLQSGKWILDGKDLSKIDRLSDTPDDIVVVSKMANGRETNLVLKTRMKNQISGNNGIVKVTVDSFTVIKGESLFPEPTEKNHEIKEVTVVGYAKPRQNASAISAENPKERVVVGHAKAGETPLYLVNGKEISEAAFKLIEENKIETVDVLKGQSDISLYGDKGKYGVIMITLKK